MKTIWLTYARQIANYYMGLEAFSLWLQKVAAVREDVLMTGNPNPDSPKWTGKDKPKNLTCKNLEMQAAVFRVRLRELILEEHD